MAIKYTKEQRDQIAKDAVGKVVQSLEYVEAEPGEQPYWVMRFTDDSETCFRFMAELC